TQALGGCTPEGSLGSLVLISPSSSVQGHLSDPITSIRDRIASLRHRVSVLLPKGLGSRTDGRSWFRAATAIGTSLTQSGHEVSFAELPDRLDGSDADGTIVVGPAKSIEASGWVPPRGMSASTGLALGVAGGSPVLALTRPEASAGEYLATDADATGDSSATTVRRLGLNRAHGHAVTLGALGVGTDALDVGDSHTWTVNYSIADMPGSRTPDRFRAILSTPSATGRWHFLVTAELNNQVVYSGVARPGVDRHIDIALPMRLQRVRNTLTVTLQRDGDLGGCQRRVTPYTVQLGPQSALVWNGTDHARGLMAAAAGIAGPAVIVAPAAVVKDMPDSLNASVPTLAELLPSLDTPRVVSKAPANRKVARVVIRAGALSGAVARLVHSDGSTTLESRRLDLDAAENTVVVSARAAGRAPARLLLAYVGDVREQGDLDFGPEAAMVVTANGPSFAITADGRVHREVIARADPS
ncbi:MAG TPA: hypothetical protein VF426_01075, partial [Marmoricola sp.]